MRRWAIALALVGALVFPIAGFGDEVAEDEASGESPAADEAPEDAGEQVAPDEEAAEGDESAEDEEAAEEEASAEEEEDEEPNALEEYGASVLERALTGLNGLLTAPADPPMAAIEPPKALAKAGYARHPLGFASGILLMGHRVLTGAVDLGLAIVPKMSVVSPVPRYKLIPGFEHEDE